MVHISCRGTATSQCRQLVNAIEQRVACQQALQLQLRHAGEVFPYFITGQRHLLPTLDTATSLHHAAAWRQL